MIHIYTHIETCPGSEKYSSSMTSDQEGGDVNEYIKVGESASCDCGSPSSDKNVSVDNAQSSCWFDDGNGDFYRNKRARRDLALIHCNLGFSIQNEYMLRFLHSLNPNFTFRDDAVKADSLRVYKEEKDRIKQILGHLDGQVSLSLEILAYGYPLLKVHFVDENWNLKVWVLRFGCGDSDDDTVEGVITSTLSDFGIWNKVSTITFKRYWVYDQIFDDIKKHVQEKRQLPLKSQLFHVHCCAALFKAMVEDAFKEIRSIINKVSELVYMGRSSSSWDHTYRFLREGLKFESENKWNKDLYDSYDKLTADEWKKVEDICKIVGYVHNVAHVLFETKIPTANIYLHQFQSLRVKLAQEAMSSNCFLSALAQKMMEKFDQYWKDMFMVLAIAAVMDPRFKMMYIEFSSSKYGSTECNYQVLTVVEALRNLCDGYMTCTTKTIESASNSCADSVEESFRRSEEEYRHCANEDLDWLHEYNEFTQSTSQPMKSDLDLYLEEPVVPWSQEFNVLSWWKTESAKYPTLSKVARDILAIPISLLRSHNAFITTERELNSGSPEIEFGSGSLESDLRNALVCTRSWFKSRSLQL